MHAQRRYLARVLLTDRPHLDAEERPLLLAECAEEQVVAVCAVSCRVRSGAVGCRSSEPPLPSIVQVVAVALMELLHRDVGLEPAAERRRADVVHAVRTAQLELSRRGGAVLALRRSSLRPSGARP